MRGIIVGRGAKQHAAVTHAYPEKLRSWRSDAVYAAQRAFAGRPTIEGPVRVTIVFHMRPPKRRVREAPTVRPDIDKLERAVLDVLQMAGIVKDDAQVVDLTASKVYAAVAPHTNVNVMEGAAPFLVEEP